MQARHHEALPPFEAKQLARHLEEHLCGGVLSADDGPLPSESVEAMEQLQRDAFKKMMEAQAAQNQKQ